MAKIIKGNKMKYYVHVITNGEPKTAHETLDEAVEEANRLSLMPNTANKEIKIYCEILKYKVVKRLEMIFDEDKND